MLDLQFRQHVPRLVQAVKKGREALHRGGRILLHVGLCVIGVDVVLHPEYVGQHRVEMGIAHDLEPEVTTCRTCGLDVERHEDHRSVGRCARFDLPGRKSYPKEECLDALLLAVRERRLVYGGETTSGIVEGRHMVLGTGDIGKEITEVDRPAGQKPVQGPLLKTFRSVRREVESTRPEVSEPAETIAAGRIDKISLPSTAGLKDRLYTCRVWGLSGSDRQLVSSLGLCIWAVI